MLLKVTLNITDFDKTLEKNYINSHGLLQTLIAMRNMH